MTKHVNSVNTMNKCVFNQTYKDISLHPYCSMLVLWAKNVELMRALRTGLRTIGLEYRTHQQELCYNRITLLNLNYPSHLQSEWIKHLKLCTCQPWGEAQASESTPHQVFSVWKSYWLSLETSEENTVLAF